MDEYFCPNCGSTLNYQSGFDPLLGVWTCTVCGQQLMDDENYDGDTYEGVAWYCDGCGTLLNKQNGFSDSYGSWTCTECGHTNGISEDNIIDGKHFICPECGSTLNNQSGFNAYDDDWECSSCGTKLTHSYYDDDYSVVEEDKIVCPNCDANLKEQWGFSEYDDDWACRECGAKLHRDYSSDEFEIVEGIEEDDDEPSSFGYTYTQEAESTQYSSQTDSWENNSSSYNRIAVSPEDKSILRKIRLKAFFTSRKRIPIGYESAQLIGKNYEEVEIKLFNQAFKNIQLISQKDVYTNSVFVDGEVESVVINGNASFLSQDIFPYDSEIIITYHEKREFTVSFSHGNLRKENYNEVKKLFIDLGFVNVYVQPIKDLTTGWIKKDGSVETVRINNKTDYRKGAIFKYDVPIVIEYHTFKKDRH